MICLCLLTFWPAPVVTEEPPPYWIRSAFKEINQQIAKYAFPNGIVGVAIKDLSSGGMFSFNSDVAFNPASVIKVPVMVAAYHQVEEGELSLDEQLILRDENKLTGSGSLQFLSSGKPYTIKRLIYLMITDSDNTATNMLIHRLKPSAINEYMREIGLVDTVIRDPSLFNKEEGQFNTTTPDDMVRLLERMYNKNLVSEKASTEMLKIMKSQHHRWGIPRFLPKQVDIANKPGSLDFVRNDIGIVFDKKHPYILAIFTRELPSNHGGSVLVGSISRIIYEKRATTSVEKGHRS
jgi:beta-lactamase class A